jgi:hypothetical protein
MNKVFKIVLTLWFTPFFGGFAQVPLMSKFDMDLEKEHRKKRHIKEEKYYKKGKLDSVYRCWDIATGQKLTDGYYIEGKRHGKWKEWLSVFKRHDFVVFNYAHDTLKHAYHYAGWASPKNDSIKTGERFYTFEPNPDNYSLHRINWDTERIGKKNEEEFKVIRNNLYIVKKKRKLWDKGIPWKLQEYDALYDKNGKALSLKKHGHWKLWNEDGTLQKETWYDMGKMLRQKLYEHGKLVSDKQY